MTGFAKALERASPKLCFIAAMRLDVVTDHRDVDTINRFAHNAQWLFGKNTAAKSLPAGGLIPALIMGQGHRLISRTQ
ncbi:hypothetical protein [Sphingopyxis yananensis]|uniref:hypothetical protein n=1 Tax=Sphingopyxis yananensis TaxID=2886687 RepID=UPI001D10F6E6|nr:hypothetical protein [Sphingopyxis yananensis]MCC2602259.1 hypothetical protein [Sphingopyxis yananensis]